MNNSTSILPNAIAFWRPAVKMKTSLVEGTTEEVIDRTSINFRASAVAISTFALLMHAATTYVAPLKVLMLLNGREFLGSLFACAFGIGAAYESFERNRAKSKITNDLLTTLNPRISTEKLAVVTLLAYGKTSEVENFLNSPECTDAYKQELLEYSLPKEGEISPKKLPNGNLRLFKLLIDTGSQLNEKQFDSVISHFDFLSYVLEKNTFNIKDLTNDQQFKILSEAHSSEELAFLIKKGFNIDVTVNQGNTILLKAILNSGNFENSSTGFSPSKKLCMFLKHVAEIPANDTVIIINDTEKMQLVNYLEDKAMTRTILKEAKKRKSEETELCPLKSDVSFWNFRKPILSIDRFNRGVTERIMVVAFSTLALGLACSLAVTSPLPFLSLLAVPLYYKYEWSRTSKTINTMVFNEFINAKFPRKEAFQYILNNETLLDRLLNDWKNLFTISDEGIPFYKYILTGIGRYDISDERKYSSFTKMTDVFFQNNRLTHEQKYLYLKAAVESGNFGYVDYIIQNAFVTAQDLTEKQVSSWPKSLKSNIADLLSKHEFKI